ncbi:MAG: SMI1/KNR4 family protein [Clostridiales Family XIII bacterium]|jgi:hypothetical protein|nr:SMI1/KNR4 family protein [Clostridiales Family XIII bacterium]
MMDPRGSDRLKYWKDQIAVLYLVQNEVQRLDQLGLYEYYYPELAATEAQLTAVEAHLGHRLDQDYRDFLLCANGWKGFIQDFNLFGTGDLMGSALMDDAMLTLQIYDEEHVLEASGFTKAELLPIAAAPFGKDLFTIARPTSRQPGVVVWFAGEEIERRPDFREYFLAMTDYNRLEIEGFKKDIAERERQAGRDADKA